MKLDLYLPVQKLIQNRLKKLRPQTLKVSEENTGNSFQDVGLSKKNSSGLTPSVNRWDCMTANAVQKGNGQQGEQTAHRMEENPYQLHCRYAEFTSSCRN